MQLALVGHRQRHEERGCLAMGCGAQRMHTHGIYTACVRHMFGRASSALEATGSAVYAFQTGWMATTERT